MPHQYQCIECDKPFFSETEPKKFLCATCSATNATPNATPAEQWTDAAFHPETKNIYRVRFKDGSEAYAVWMPDLKGWAVDLPMDFMPGDPIPDKGPPVQYRKLAEGFE